MDDLSVRQFFEFGGVLRNGMECGIFVYLLRYLHAMKELIRFRSLILSVVAAAVPLG